MRNILNHYAVTCDIQQQSMAVKSKAMSYRTLKNINIEQLYYHYVIIYIKERKTVVHSDYTLHTHIHNTKINYLYI